MLEIKRLRLLWELSERGTIAAVAQALNYSPSAVSQQLTLLERELATPLLIKVGRKLTLTPAAEALVLETAELLAGLERASTAVHRLRGQVRGTLRIAVFQTALLALLPPVLGSLRKAHPELRVEMVQHEPEIALYETSVRSFDLVVAEQYPGHAALPHSNLDRAPLTRDSIKLALPQVAEAQFAQVTQLAAAADLPWVMEPPGAASRHWAMQACHLAGFAPDVRYETADLQAHIQLVASGNAVALLPGLAYQAAPTKLRLLPLAGNPERTIFTAARTANAQHPAVVAVRKALAREAAALARNARPA